LSPFETPVCTPDGVIFDLVNLLPYIRKHKCNPINGEPMTSQEIIRLNMEKNSDNKWHCPVTCKVFTNNSHIIVIKTTGTVLSYDAVLELNIKPKNFIDLITNEPFSRNDIITLLNPLDHVHSAKRDISNFIHLQQVRQDYQEESKDESKIRSNPVSTFVMKELEARANEDPSIRAKKRALELVSSSEDFTDDVKELLALGALTCDVNPGQMNTSGQASSSLTSTVMTQSGSSATRLASAEELREARWRKLRQVFIDLSIYLPTLIINYLIYLYIILVG
jgi:peptidyl-prolyl cis-trans isomerase-like protein 2